MTTVVATQQLSQVIVSEDEDIVVIRQKELATVEVVATGPQGPPGGAAYVHSQPSSSATWTINHNLGYVPSIELFDSGSQEIEATVTHPSINQAVILFTIPSAGFARLI